MLVNELRQILVDLIGDQLGTYTYPNGRKTPAIQISPPRVPDDVAIAGIECIIQRDPQQTPKATSSGEILISQRWSVRFTQYDRSNAKVTQLTEVKYKVMAFFPRCTPFHVPQTDVNEEQIGFYIQDWQFIKFTG